MTVLRVMVVEDDADLRSVLSRGPTEEGFDVVEAADGRAALSRAGETIDALVLDVGLPDADGRPASMRAR